MEEHLETYLRSLGPLQALVGDRVYPHETADPEAPLPRVTYFLVSGRRMRNLTDGPDGMGNPRYQIDCWGKTYKEAKQVARAIVDDLDGFSGKKMGGELGVYVNNVVVEDQSDHLTEAEQGKNKGTYQVTLDVLIWYEEG